MGTPKERKAELADFLRTRRRGVDRRDFGLPEGVRGQSSGLRREEVAFLSGVSVTWYTWLEQARDSNPSRQVLEALSRALRLTVREHAYVLELAGFSPSHPAEPMAVRPAPDHVQRLLDALVTFPSYAITSGWGIAGWNAAYEALYPSIATVAEEDRNLLWLVFTDPYVRKLLPNWESDSHHFLAQFRAEAGPRLGDPAFASLVTRLSDASREFRKGWDSHSIEPFASRERTFHHPLVGDLQLEHNRLSPSDHPDLHVVIYTPANQLSSDRMRRLLET